MIRAAVAADTKGIAHVHRSSRAEAYGDTGPGRELSPTFVWDHDGAIVGFSAIDGEDLSALYVLPGVQGGGIGAELLRLAVKEGARTLWVYSANAGARRFYERHGWVAEPETEVTGALWMPKEPALRYRVHAVAAP